MAFCRASRMSLAPPFAARPAKHLTPRLQTPRVPIREYKVSGSELRNGQVVERKGKLWQVVKTLLITPGRRASIVQVEFKDILTGTKMNERLRSEEKVELVELENIKGLFEREDEDGGFVFKDPRSFDEVKIKAEDIDPDLAPWLRVGGEYHIKRAEDPEIAVVIFPNKTVWEVKSIEDGRAVLANGKHVVVPAMIKVGDRICIKLPEAKYSHRATKDEEEEGGAAPEETVEAQEEQAEEEQEEDKKK